MSRILLSLFLITIVSPLRLAAALEPIPDKLVVLTFDDSVKSHFTVARPLLKQFQFGATFFVTEGFNYHEKPEAYLSWDEIRTLHDDGFEIGNHLKTHMGVNQQNVPRLEEELAFIDERCEAHGIPKTVSFAWPGCFLHRDALPVLQQHGILWGRRCVFPEKAPQESRGYAYQPEHDHSLLIPCVGIPGPGWTVEDFAEVMSVPKSGEIAVICFHGTPETEHPWVNTPADRFEEMLTWLHDQGYTAIAMRDLARYVDPAKPVADPWKIIDTRKAAQAK